MRKFMLVSALAAVGAGACGCASPRPVYVVQARPVTAWQAHVDWCLAHHAGYDPSTNLFIARDGYPRACR